MQTNQFIDYVSLKMKSIKQRYFQLHTEKYQLYQKYLQCGYPQRTAYLIMQQVYPQIFEVEADGDSSKYARFGQINFSKSQFIRELHNKSYSPQQVFVKDPSMSVSTMNKIIGILKIQAMTRQQKVHMISIIKLQA